MLIDSRRMSDERKLVYHIRVVADAVAEDDLQILDELLGQSCNASFTLKLVNYMVLQLFAILTFLPAVPYQIWPSQCPPVSHSN